MERLLTEEEHIKLGCGNMMPPWELTVLKAQDAKTLKAVGGRLEDILGGNVPDRDILNQVSYLAETLLRGEMLE